MLTNISDSNQSWESLKAISNKSDKYVSRNRKEKYLLNRKFY